MTSFGDGGYAEWSESERDIYDSLVAGHSNIHDNSELQELFHEAMFNPEYWNTGGGLEIRADFEDALIDKLDSYEIDFWEMFDWEAYQEWYDSQ